MPVTETRFINKKIFILFMVMSSLLSGCGLVDFQHENKVSSSLVDYLYPNKVEQNELAVNAEHSIPELTLPVRVGIAFVPGNNNYRSPLSQKMQFDLLLKSKEQFSQYPFVEHIEIIPSNYLKPRGGFTNLEQVARLYDVDIMALVSYDQIQKNFARDSSILYLTILGGIVMKGDANEAHTFVDTSVFDMPSKKLLFRAPGTNKLSKNSNVVDKQRVQDQIASQGFAQAMDEMVINLDSELSHFKERVKNEKIAKISYSSNYSGGGGSVSIVLLILLGARRMRLML